MTLMAPLKLQDKCTQPDIEGSKVAAPKNHYQVQH